jgi:hypothetical protein
VDIRRRIEELDGIVANAQVEKASLLDELALSMTDIRVGDRVTHGGPDEYEVRRIYLRFDIYLTFIGARIKGDGTPGIRGQQIVVPIGRTLRKV